jgi:hypothetical protein
VFVDTGSEKEKRARLVETRPEPTIYGNCDSWDFIVGKTARMQSPKTPWAGSCCCATKILCTTYSQLINQSHE